MPATGVQLGRSHKRRPVAFADAFRLWHRREMTDELMLTCKDCGAILTFEASEPDAKPGPDTVLSCPDHGPMGRRDDLIKTFIFEKLANDLKGTTISITKETGD
jgi:hypothetical protein